MTPRFGRALEAITPLITDTMRRPLGWCSRWQAASQRAVPDFDPIGDLERARLTLAELDAFTGESSHGATKSSRGQDPEDNEFEVMWMLPKEEWGEYAAVCAPIAESGGAAAGRAERLKSDQLSGIFSERRTRPTTAGAAY